MPQQVQKAQGLSLQQAKDLTKQIRSSKDKLERAYENFRNLVLKAFHEKVDETMGYLTWEEYVEAEFDSLPRWTKTERKQLSRDLKAAGMTTREIGATTGTSAMQASRDTSPEPVTKVTNQSNKSSQPDPPEPAPRFGIYQLDENGDEPWAVDTTVHEGEIVSDDDGYDDLAMIDGGPDPMDHFGRLNRECGEARQTLLRVLSDDNLVPDVVTLIVNELLPEVEEIASKVREQKGW